MRVALRCSGGRAPEVPGRNVGCRCVRHDWWCILCSASLPRGVSLLMHFQGSSTCIMRQCGGPCAMATIVLKDGAMELEFAADDPE